MKAHEPLKRRRLKPSARSFCDLIVDTSRDTHAEQFGFALFQRLGLSDLPDFIIGKLLKPSGALTVGQREILRDLLQPRRDRAQDRLAAADDALEDADAQEAALIDVEVDRARRDDVVDRNGLARLAVLINQNSNGLR
jgi:hypothetical protein